VNLMFMYRYGRLAGWGGVGWGGVVCKMGLGLALDEAGSAGDEIRAEEEK
jgi:hypothetical protein